MSNISNISPNGAVMEFGGKKLKLVFQIMSMRYLIEKYGEFLGTVMKAVGGENGAKGEINIDALVSVLYAGFMVNEDPEITLEWVSAALDKMPIYAVGEITQKHIIAAFSGAYPESEKKDGEKVP